MNLEMDTFDLPMAPVDTPEVPSPRIIQITDTHLFAHQNGRLLGLETALSLRAIIDEISLHETVDLILVTGDLAQDASSEAYRMLAEHLAVLHLPVAWLPGNHDDIDVMRRCLINKYLVPHKRITAGNWQIVMLDSVSPGNVHGVLSEQQLDFLHRCLTQNPDLWALVVLHHQPVQIGSRWLDRIGLRNSAEFFAVLARHRQLRGILWGHVHQEFERISGTVRMMATPSSCVQFQPGSEDFEAGRQAPGYRVLSLLADGGIDSEVKRIAAIPFTIDYDVKGY